MALRRLTALPLGATVALAACTVSTTTPAPAYAPPPMGAGFDYQLGGDAPIPDGVTVVVRDWLEGSAPPDGVYGICYVNAFQSQPPNDWPPEVVTDIEDPDWPGEFVIDIGTPSRRSAAIGHATEMIRHCAAAGFAAVEFDNLDTFSRFDDLPFGRADTVAYATALVAAAHAAGLAAAQKNTPELAGEPIGFDFAIAEECGVYDECSDYFRAFGDHLLVVEYTDDGLAAACAALGDGVSIILRDLYLVPPDDPDYRYATCRSALAATP